MHAFIDSCIWLVVASTHLGYRATCTFLAEPNPREFDRSLSEPFIGVRFDKSFVTAMLSLVEIRLQVVTKGRTYRVSGDPGGLAQLFLGSR